MPSRPVVLAAFAIVAASCGGDDEPRLLPRTDAPTPAQRLPTVVTSSILAGGVRADPKAVNPYEDDEHALAAGRQLYTAMNCAGCHGPSGGGGMGPPLADADWIYGSAPENIVQSILAGRPNGMPAFGGRLPPSEAWKIATFVQHLSKGAERSGDSPAIGSAKGSATAGRGP